MEEETFRLSWDRLQRQFQCCGTINFNTGYRDWKSSFGAANNSVPDSCCHEESLNCGSGIYSGSLPPMSIHHHGCLTVIQESELTELIQKILIKTVWLCVLVG